MSDPKALTITRHLPVPLTDRRKLELADDLGNHVNVYKQLEKLKKDTSDQYTKSMASHRTESEAIAQVIAQGAEMKPVACEQRTDLASNKLEVRRMDTGEVIESRALTAEEIKHYRNGKP